MYVLGIETSCDETSCAVVRNRKILSNSTLTSLKDHARYGGIVPEIAHRNHLRVIDRVLKRALGEAGISLRDIGLIGVTARPGLLGALLVGLNFAKGLSLSLGKPFLGINHLQAHLFSPFLNSAERMTFPFLGVVVSGGHTELFLVRDFDKMKVLATTIDDACGEVFDKVGRAFGLGFPAGPVIDRLYEARYKDVFRFKCGRVGRSLSFSGIKTALIYKKRELQEQGLFDQKTKVAVLSSFQETMVTAIVNSAISVAKEYNITKIICGGGVVANRRFRSLMAAKEKEGFKILFPGRGLSQDNGAMVAGLAGYLYTKSKVTSRLSLEPVSN